MAETIDFELQVRDICRKNGFEINDQYFLLHKYVNLLLDWNEKINLISRNDIHNVWRNHILHSLSVLLLLKVPPKTKILDLGTGGGLPGIPISIIREDIQVTLLDSIKKKTMAVQSMVEAMGLQNVNVMTGRAEEIVIKGNERWDMVVSRAVAPLSELIEWSKQLLQHSDRKKIEFDNKSWHTPLLVALKGGNLDMEIEAAERKWGLMDIRVRDISFDDNQIVGMNDKKIVIVKM